MTSDRPLRLATRPSPLALLQARTVADLLVQAGVDVDDELVTVSTVGDLRHDVPLSELGGKGVFAREVQTAVLAGRADLAVHSAKDLTPVTGNGLTLAAVPRREDPRDALVGASLDDLAPGATVATGSVRRRAQLAALRPDLTFVDLRGNIATRLGKVPPGGVVVVAAAALLRLGLADRATEVLPTFLVLPQVSQGALAVECRFGDARTAELAGRIEDGSARRCVEAERAFLAALGGNCDLPVGALASEAGRADGTGGADGADGTGGADGADGTGGADGAGGAGETGSDTGLVLEAMCASADGRVLVRHRLTGGEPAALGTAMASYMAEEAGLADVIDLEMRGLAEIPEAAWDPR